MMEKSIAGEVENLVIGMLIVNQVADRLYQVGLAQTNVAVNEKRIEDRLARVVGYRHAG